MNIWTIIGIVIVVLIIVGAIVHGTYFKRRLKQINPYGKLVNIDGGQIHVYSMGNGKKTIVLLPGLGVALPSAEFSPLMRKLSEKYTMVCVEYFGVGFSSQALKPRTCENYIEETREALKKAGFKAPYVLMPHSVSGIYSEYYAAKHPDEVEGVMALDSTSTAIYEKMPSILKVILPIAKIQQNIGITSLIGPLAVNKKDLRLKGYTEKEIRDLIVFAGFSINKTILEQMTNASEFIKETMDLPFPSSIPYFKIISKQTYETPNKQLKMTPQEYQRQHLERIGKDAKFEVLEGTHFIYLNNIDKIAEITDDFISNIIKNKR